MDALVKEDMDRYQVALQATGGTFGDIEPISRFHEAYQDEVDLTYARRGRRVRTPSILREDSRKIWVYRISDCWY